MSCENNTMSAELSRHRGRPPPPAWKPPPLPDDIESLTSRISFGSENLSDKSQVKEIESLRSSSKSSEKVVPEKAVPVNVVPEKIVPETSWKKTPNEGRVQSAQPSQTKPESKVETFNQKSEFPVRTEKKSEHKLFQPKNSESNLSSKFPSSTPEKKIFGQQKENSIKAVREPQIQTRVPIEPSTTAPPSQLTMATTTTTTTPASRVTATKPTLTSNKPLENPPKIETPKKDHSDESKIASKSQAEVSTFKLKNGNESSKQEGLTGPKISIEKPDSGRNMDDLPKGAFEKFISRSQTRL